ncbi:Putative membrane protein [Gloeomargarita lithophora Alchichica-D10]|uniref:Membrane protein n=1 Tax=Gloeomargarita lithophora Alchichica-D10 TaxID=1188229 RepID=A0A1J0AGQ2_9CYAN|nr:FUSC family protein [Gloeomargarita lithophora]APB35129.1 Putative membrane protein [Gloeomargarita lithophora Alchichica-D10]
MQWHRSRFLRLILKLEVEKLAIANGLRSALALGVPLGIGELVRHPESGLLVGLMAFFVNLANVGGSYRSRALAMGTATLGIAISVFVGTLGADIPPLAVGLMLLWGLGCGLAYLYGEVGSIVGLVVGISFIFAINTPGDFTLALERLLLCLVAGGWAMLLSLIMWPFTPYTPLQASVAACYRAIADYIQEFPKKAIPGEIDPTKIRYVLKIRQTLERARTVLGTQRLGQEIRSWMDEQLLILIHDAERLFGSVTALIELTEVTAGYQRFHTVQLLTNQALSQMANLTQGIAQTISGQSVALSLDNLQPIYKALQEQERWQKIALSTPAKDYSALGPLVHLVHLVEKLMRQFEHTMESAKALHLDSKPIQHRGERLLVPQPPPGKSDAPPVFFAPLRDNLTLDSAIFRHALRLGVALAVGVVVYTTADLAKGYWTTITIIFVLKPDFGSTFERFFHRVGGTILGAIVAAVLLATITNKFVLDALIIVAVFLGISLLKVHYGYAVTFFSIFVLLLTDRNNPAGWEFIDIRVVNTLIGAGLAIVAHALMWPNWERQRYSSQLAHAVRECHNYFQTVMAVYLGEGERKAAIPNQKRQTGLAIINAQASCQRLLGEPQTPPELAEPLMTILVYLSRFTNAVTALNVHLDPFAKTQPLPELETCVQQISVLLNQIAEALQQETLPPDLPDLDSGMQSLDLRLKALHADYLQKSTPSAPNYQFVDNYSVVKMESEQIVRWLTALHSALVRLHTAKLQNH